MGIYQENFTLIQETIVNNSKYDRQTVLDRFKPFENFDFDSFDDTYLYHVLAYVPFYSGMDSKTVTDKRGTILEYFDDYNKVANYDSFMIEKMMNDPDMIKNRAKIDACVYNARIVKGLAERYGSFKNYLVTLNFNNSPQDLEYASNVLQRTFKYLGEVTSHHFLTDIGAKTIKPDRVIMRVLTRLKLVRDESCFEDARKICNEIVNETGYSHRYIDIVMVKFGHRKDDMDTGIIKGICLEDNPNCSKCLLTENCYYTKQNKGEINMDKVEKLQEITEQNEQGIDENITGELAKIDTLKKLDPNLKMLLTYLLQGVKSHNVQYGIKLRRDAFALTLKYDESKNISTIWLMNGAFRLLVLRAPGTVGEQSKKGKLCSSINDIDEDVFMAIKNKFDEIR